MKDKEYPMDIKRKQYIDIAKGIAMLLVILSHTISLNVWQEGVLASLHNPSFFFVSGILFYSSGEKLQNGEATAGDIFRKKLAHVVYPFAIWVLIYSFLEICLGYALHDAVPAIFDVVLGEVNRLWFLPMIFIAFCFVYVVWILKIDARIILVIWGMSIFVTSLYSIAISKMLFCSFLVFLGTLCAKIHFSHKMTLLLLCIYIVMVYCAYFIPGGGIQQSDSLGVGYKYFLHYLMGTEGAFMVVSISYQISVRVQRIRCLSAIGKDSIYFYVLHYSSVLCLGYMAVRNIAIEIVCFSAAVIIPFLYVKFVKKTILNCYLFGVK